jgi:hypothetical protein
MRFGIVEPSGEFTEHPQVVQHVGDFDAFRAVNALGEFEGAMVNLSGLRIAPQQAK